VAVDALVLFGFSRWLLPKSALRIRAGECLRAQENNV